MLSRYHIDNTWNVVEQAANLVIPDVILLDLSYGDVENAVDSKMQEDFKFAMKILSE